MSIINQQADKMEACEKVATFILHEFNNILATITYSVELAIDDIPKDTETYNDLERALTTGVEAGEFISSIMTFCKPQKSGLKRTNIIDCINNSIITIKESIPANISLESNIPDDSLYAIADSEQIFVIISEIIQNAVNSISENNGTIKINIDKLCLNKPDNSESLRIIISDSGPGIHEDVINKIFDPFFTTNQSISKGIGLSTVYSYVKNHAGTLQVSSKPGEHTFFEILLPIL